MSSTFSSLTSWSTRMRWRACDRTDDGMGSRCKLWPQVKYLMFIQPPKMKSCRKESSALVHLVSLFPHVVFSIVFPSRVHSFSVSSLFCLVLFTFLSRSIPISLFLPPPIPSPSVDLVRVGWFRHQREDGGVLMHDIGEHRETKQERSRPWPHCLISRCMWEPACSSVAKSR